MANDRRIRRARVLASFGASGAVVEELLSYNDPAVLHREPVLSLPFPLPAEPHVAAWESYAAEAVQRGAWAMLRDRLVQLRFPVRQGISQTEGYRAATRQGVSPDSVSEATGLTLSAPDKLRLWVHASLAGPLPVLCTSEREDFVRLVQALSGRNEPEPVPAAQGACLVAGLNNWDRVRQSRQHWIAKGGTDQTWAEEFRRIIPQKELYQDRFVILSEGYYSNVAAEEMGLSAEEWRRLSLTIRLEHECTHYFTLRVFGSMRNNLLDELIADHEGIVAACGRYRADWFLRFVGLEDFPRYREGGRLENYRGQPPLSDAAFRVLQALVKAAAENLERLDRCWFPASRTPEERGRLISVLYHGTLEEIALGHYHENNASRVSPDRGLS
jgi:Family of unknown function (DUF7005)